MTEPCEQVLAGLTAAFGAQQVLAQIDGDGVVTVLDGTLEVGMPGCQVRRRSWPPHPDCGCGASRAPRAG